MRWAGPLLCFGVAIGIFGTLHLGEQNTWVLVGVDRVVGPSPEAQAALSWKLMAFVGVLWAGWLGLKSPTNAVPDE